MTMLFNRWRKLLERLCSIIRAEKSFVMIWYNFPFMNSQAKWTYSKSFTLWRFFPDAREHLWYTCKRYSLSLKFTMTNLIYILYFSWFESPLIGSIQSKTNVCGSECSFIGFISFIFYFIPYIWLHPHHVCLYPIVTSSLIFTSSLVTLLTSPFIIHLISFRP